MDQLNTDLEYSWKLAERCKKGAAIRQEHYNCWSQGEALKKGDHELVPLVSFDGPHRLSSSCDPNPYLIVREPEDSVLVYKLAPELGKGRVCCLQPFVVCG